jgi:hypothetical protein
VGELSRGGETGEAYRPVDSGVCSYTVGACGSTPLTHLFFVLDIERLRIERIKTVDYETITKNKHH